MPTRSSTMLFRRRLALGFVAALFFAAPARATGYLFCTFKGDTAPGEKLSIYTSTDALSFTLLSDTGFGGASGNLRDPSIMRHTDGKYYVAYTDPLGAGCCGKVDHFSIASSTDKVHWTDLTMVSAGVPGVAHTWAPEWFVDGATVTLVANIDTLNTDSDFKPYLFTARDSTLTSWSGPVAMGIGPNYIDTFVLKSGGKYHAFAKNETTRYVEHATAASLTGPWTFVGVGNWAGWGSGMEGPDVVQLDDGTWRIFMDGQGAAPFLTATSPDLNTWSATVALPGLGNVVRQGTVIRDTPAAGTTPDAGAGFDAGGGGAPGVDAAADGALASGVDSGGVDAVVDASQFDDGAGSAGPGREDSGVPPGAGGPSPSDGGGFPGQGSGAEAGVAAGATGPGAGCSCRSAERRGTVSWASASAAPASLALFALIGWHRRRRSRARRLPREALAARARDAGDRDGDGEPAN